MSLTAGVRQTLRKFEKLIQNKHMNTPTNENKSTCNADNGRELRTNSGQEYPYGIPFPSPNDAIDALCMKAFGAYPIYPDQAPTKPAPTIPQPKPAGLGRNCELPDVSASIAKAAADHMVKQIDRMMTCDCTNSSIRKVDSKHPHPAISREGWFCMGCLNEFRPISSINNAEIEKLHAQWQAKYEQAHELWNIDNCRNSDRIAELERQLAAKGGCE